MNILIYFTVATASLGIAFGIYRLFFRNELRFRDQRLFLLGSIAISLLVPLSPISIHLRVAEKELTEITNPVTIPGTNTAQPMMVTEKGLIQLITGNILYIYIIVSAAYFLVLAIHLARILLLYRSSVKIKQGDITVLRNEKVKSPFSFFNWVFIPLSLSDNDEINSIIIHERVHANNYHTLDNLLLELLSAFMWFNPFAWMIKQSLHLVHEYMADEGTLEAGIEKVSYQALLINQAAEVKLIYIPSTFNNNLKKRMIMMTKSKNCRHNNSGKMKLIPLSLILLIAVAVINGFFISDANASEGKQENKQKVKTDKNKEITVTGKPLKQEQESNDKNKEITVTGYPLKEEDRNKEIMVVGYGNKQGAETLNYIVDGVTTKSIDDIPADSIESVNVLKTDRTVIIRTKSFARKHPNLQGTIQVRANNGINDNVLYILDDKPVTKEEFQQLDMNIIQSVDVIKSKEQMKKYTDKDYDGLILVKTKK